MRTTEQRANTVEGVGAGHKEVLVSLCSPTKCTTEVERMSSDSKTVGSVG